VNSKLFLHVYSYTHTHTHKPSNFIHPDESVRDRSYQYVKKCVCRMTQAVEDMNHEQSISSMATRTETMKSV